MTASQDIIRLMLARATLPEGGGGDYADASDYDWTQPHNLPQELLFAAEELLNRSGDGLSVALGKVVRDEVPVKTGDVAEAYASALVEAAQDDERLYIPLLTGDDQPYGYISTLSASAAQWVAKLLGGSTGQGAREMSALELSLLGDVMASLATAILAPICTAADIDITPGRSVSPAIVPLGEATAEFIEVDFTRADEDEQLLLTAVVRSDAVVAAVTGRKETAARSGADLRRSLIEHLSHVSVTAVAHLGQTETSIRDAAALGVGDVLVLDTRLDDEVDVFVQGTRIAMGTPASCGGYNAIQVTEIIRAGGEDPRRDSDDTND